MSFADVPKTVLITGCSEGGIGEALCKSFHRQGAQVIATARNLSKVDSLKKLGLTILELDVVDPVSVRKAVETTAGITGGKLDILVNNAGGGYVMPLLDADINEAKRLFDVNVFSVISTTQAFFPLLHAAKGTVITIGSIAGMAPFPWQGFYNASKAAVNILSDNLRLELEPLGVKVICVITGGIKTNFYANTASKDIPEDSYYYSYHDVIEHAHDYSEAAMINVDNYADRFVKNVLQPQPNVRPWFGGGSTRVWLATTFLWHTFADFILPSRYGITEIKKRASEAKKLL